MFEDILEYQNKDLQLIKIQREIENLPSKKVMDNMVVLVKELQQKSVSLEKEAGELKGYYFNIEKEIKELDKQIDAIDKDGEVESNISLLTKLNSNIANLQNKLSKTQARIEDVLKQFDNAKKKVMVAKTKHKEAKAEVEKAEKKYSVIIEDLNKKISLIKKNIEPKLIKKYEELKADNVMPVFVNKIENSCGGCRTELSASALEKIKASKYLACEHCRRIMINKD